MIEFTPIHPGKVRVEVRSGCRTLRLGYLQHYGDDWYYVPKSKRLKRVLETDDGWATLESAKAAMSEAVARSQRKGPGFILGHYGSDRASLTSAIRRLPLAPSYVRQADALMSLEIDAREVERRVFAAAAFGSKPLLNLAALASLGDGLRGYGYEPTDDTGDVP